VASAKLGELFEVARGMHARELVEGGVAWCQHGRREPTFTRQAEGLSCGHEPFGALGVVTAASVLREERVVDEGERPTGRGGHQPALVAGSVVLDKQERPATLPPPRSG
jgi:hypothetical protein